MPRDWRRTCATITGTLKETEGPVKPKRRPARSSKIVDGVAPEAYLSGALLAINSVIANLEARLETLRVQRKHIISAQAAEQKLTRSFAAGR